MKRIREPLFVFGEQVPVGTPVIAAVGQAGLQRTTTMAYDAADNRVAVSTPQGYDLDANGQPVPSIDDLQVGISLTGRVKIIDLNGVSIGTGPSRTNLKTIDLVMDVARRRIGK